MNWEKVKMGEHIEVLSGFAFDSKLFNDSKGIPLVRIRDVGRDYSETYYDGDFDNRYVLSNGDLLVSMDGEFRIAEWKGGKALLNQRVCKINPKNGTIEKKFLLYLMPFELLKIEHKTSFVTVKHLSVKDINAIEIPLPPFSIQQKIAAILDKADELRKKDQQLLAKYDELLQSIFYDMFGDPVKNEKGWETKTIDQIVKKENHSIKRGPFGGALKKEIFVADGYLVYEQFHALNNDFSFARYYIDEKRYKELEAFDVRPGDIIISCSGIYLGKLAIVPNNAKPGIINQALLKLSLDNKLYRNEFFLEVFGHENFKQKYFPSERGVAIPNFPPMPTFKTFKFIAPPISFQNRFTSIAQNIQQQKQQVKQQIEQSENLFQSLMQRGFKGELIK